MPTCQDCSTNIKPPLRGPIAKRCPEHTRQFRNQVRVEQDQEARAQTSKFIYAHCAHCDERFRSLTPQIYCRKHRA